MDATTQSSVLGPATFFGLSLYVLVTSTPAEQEFANPADMMNLDDLARGPLLAALFAPFPDIGPPEHPPSAPRIFALQQVAPAAPADRPAPAAPGAIAPIVPVETAVLRQPPAPVLTTVMLPAHDARPADGVPETPPGADLDTGFAPPPHDWFEVAGSSVNVRTGPGTAHPSLTQLDRGIPGLRIAVDGDWTLLQFPQGDTPVQGWMSSDYLEPLSP